MNHLRYALALSFIILLTACSHPEHEAEPVSDAAADLELTGTSWQLVIINGSEVIDESVATMLFPEDGKVVGSSGCNRYFGSVVVAGSTISFGDAGATMMACPEPLMQQERAFFAALSGIVRGEIDGDSHLVLFDDAGEPRIRATEYAPTSVVTDGEQPQPLDKASNEQMRFDCGQAGVAAVRFLGPDTVELSFAGETYALPHERAASGAKYASTGVSFWNKGDEAAIEIGGDRRSCIRIYSIDE